MLISDPPGSRVAIDGKVMPESTPIEVTLPAGLRRFELKKEGFQTVQFSLDLKEGSRLSKSMLLIPASSIASSDGEPVLDFLDKSPPAQDSFESNEEYQERLLEFEQSRLAKLLQFNKMAGNPIFSAGKVSLLKEQYDQQSGQFPVKISLREWSEGLIAQEDSYLYLSREEAKKLYNRASEHHLYIDFTPDGTVDHLYIFSQEKKYYLMGFGRFDSAFFKDRFSLIDADCFVMGNDRGDQDERPEHTVCLDSFWMGRYEVTQGEWGAVMGKNPSRHQRGAAYPVEQVSWLEIKQFIEKLNEKGGQQFRLPTEAEWEFASLGGAQTLYPWGDDKPVCVSKAVNGAQFDDNKECDDTGTSAVGRFGANYFGLYDMAGNVREWVEDRYGSDYYAGSPEKNPTGPDRGSSRVFRGGGWSEPPTLLRSSLRSYNEPDFIYNDLGFRLVLIPQ
ncbi:MAG: SUMF1/EgtB/PvdO family nonheme iron enzyme [Magnetococcales bacterium]|nr:SUMF1/EgtB/PvdO family nonheme iron enzyme [Magnetococcales bacterium]